MKSYPFKRQQLPFYPLLVMALTSATPLARAQNVPARISLTVIEGEGATTGIRQRVARDPVVKVEDDDHRPVSGAAVVFALPVSGASGEFMNGSKTLTVTTDPDGLATAHALKTNEVSGKLQIYVTAAYHGLRARTLINQFVAASPGARAKTPELKTSKSGSKWKWVVLGVAAAGGTCAGVYYGTHNNTSPVSISTGTVVFGSPR
jgi:hypothetical protein